MNTQLVRRYTRFEELTNAMINEFIERVEIHEGVWSESGGQYKGTRRQEVDIYLKYVGKFIAPDMRSQEEIEAERIAEEKAERERTRRRENARKRAGEKRETEAVPATPKPAA